MDSRTPEGMVAIVTGLNDAGLSVTLTDARQFDYAQAARRNRSQDAVTETQNQGFSRTVSSGVQTCRPPDRSRSTAQLPRNKPWGFTSNIGAYHQTPQQQPKRSGLCASLQFVASRDVPTRVPNRNMTPEPAFGRFQQIPVRDVNVRSRSRATSPTDPFVESLRKYPACVADSTMSVDLVQRLLTYTQVKNVKKSSLNPKRVRSLTRPQNEGPSYTVKKSLNKNIQTYTRTRQQTPLESIYGKFETKRKRNASPEKNERRNWSPARRHSMMSYDYLKVGTFSHRPTDVRYLNDVTRFVRDTLRQAGYLSDVCPSMLERYGQHRKEFHQAEVGTLTIEEREHNAQTPGHSRCYGSNPRALRFTSLDSDESYCSGLSDICRICNNKPCRCDVPPPCGCLQNKPLTLAEKLRSLDLRNAFRKLYTDVPPYDPCICPSQGLQNSIADIVDNWIQHVPITACYTEQDKKIREEIVLNLQTNLKTYINDEAKCRALVELEKLPVIIDDRDLLKHTENLADSIVEEIFKEAIQIWAFSVPFVHEFSLNEFVNDLYYKLKELIDVHEKKMLDYNMRTVIIEELDKATCIPSEIEKYADGLLNILKNTPRPRDKLKETVINWIEKIPVSCSIDKEKLTSQLLKKLKLKLPSTTPNDAWLTVKRIINEELQKLQLDCLLTEMEDLSKDLANSLAPDDFDNAVYNWVRKISGAEPDEDSNRLIKELTSNLRNTIANAGLDNVDDTLKEIIMEYLDESCTSYDVIKKKALADKLIDEFHKIPKSENIILKQVEKWVKCILFKPEPPVHKIQLVRDLTKKIQTKLKISEPEDAWSAIKDMAADELKKLPIIGDASKMALLAESLADIIISGVITDTLEQWVKILPFHREFSVNKEDLVKALENIFLNLSRSSPDDLKDDLTNAIFHEISELPTKANINQTEKLAKQLVVKLLELPKERDMISETIREWINNVPFKPGTTVNKYKFVTELTKKLKQITKICDPETAGSDMKAAVLEILNKNPLKCNNEEKETLANTLLQKLYSNLIIQTVRFWVEDLPLKATIVTEKTELSQNLGEAIQKIVTATEPGKAEPLLKDVINSNIVKLPVACVSENRTEFLENLVNNLIVRLNAILSLNFFEVVDNIDKYAVDLSDFIEGTHETEKQKLAIKALDKLQQVGDGNKDKNLILELQRVIKNCIEETPEFSKLSEVGRVKLINILPGRITDVAMSGGLQARKPKLIKVINKALDVKDPDVKERLTEKLYNIIEEKLDTSQLNVDTELSPILSSSSLRGLSFKSEATIKRLSIESQTYDSKNKARSSYRVEDNLNLSGNNLEEEKQSISNKQRKRSKSIYIAYNIEGNVDESQKCKTYISQGINTQNHYLLPEASHEFLSLYSAKSTSEFDEITVVNKNNPKIDKIKGIDLISTSPSGIQADQYNINKNSRIIKKPMQIKESYASNSNLLSIKDLLESKLKVQHKSVQTVHTNTNRKHTSFIEVAKYEIQKWINNIPQLSSSIVIKSKNIENMINALAKGLAKIESQEPDDTRKKLKMKNEINEKLDSGLKYSGKRLDNKKKLKLTNELLERLVRIGKTQLQSSSSLELKDSLGANVYDGIQEWMETISVLTPKFLSEKVANERAEHNLTDRLGDLNSQDINDKQVKKEMLSKIKKYSDVIFDEKGISTDANTKSKMTQDLLDKITLTAKKVNSTSSAASTKSTKSYTTSDTDNKTETSIENAIKKDIEVWAEDIPQSKSYDLTENKQKGNITEGFSKILVDLQDKRNNEKQTRNKMRKNIRGILQDVFNDKGKHLNIKTMNALTDTLLEQVLDTIDQAESIGSTISTKSTNSTSSDGNKNLESIINQEVKEWISDILELKCDNLAKVKQINKITKDLSKTLVYLRARGENNKIHNQMRKEIKGALIDILDDTGQLEYKAVNELTEMLLDKVLGIIRERNSIVYFPESRSLQSAVKTWFNSISELKPINSNDKRKNKRMWRYLNTNISNYKTQNMNDVELKKNMALDIKHVLDAAFASRGISVSTYVKDKLTNNLLEKITESMIRKESPISLTQITPSAPHVIAVNNKISKLFKDIPELKNSFQMIAKDLVNKFTNSVRLGVTDNRKMKSEIKKSLNATLNKKGEYLDVKTKRKLSSKLFNAIVTSIEETKTQKDTSRGKSSQENQSNKLIIKWHSRSNQSIPISGLHEMGNETNDEVDLRDIIESKSPINLNKKARRIRKNQSEIIELHSGSSSENKQITEVNKAEGFNKDFYDKAVRISKKYKDQLSKTENVLSPKEKQTCIPLLDISIFSDETADVGKVFQKDILQWLEDITEMSSSTAAEKKSNKKCSQALATKLLEIYNREPDHKLKTNKILPPIIDFLDDAIERKGCLVKRKDKKALANKLANKIATNSAKYGTNSAKYATNSEKYASKSNDDSKNMLESKKSNSQTMKILDSAKYKGLYGPKVTSSCSISKVYYVEDLGNMKEISKKIEPHVQAKIKELITKRKEHLKEPKQLAALRAEVITLLVKEAQLPEDEAVKLSKAIIQKLKVTDQDKISEENELMELLRDEIKKVMAEFLIPEEAREAFESFVLDILAADLLQSKSDKEKKTALLKLMQEKGLSDKDAESMMKKLDQMFELLSSSSSISKSLLRIKSGLPKNFSVSLKEQTEFENKARRALNKFVNEYADQPDSGTKNKIKEVIDDTLFILDDIFIDTHLDTISKKKSMEAALVKQLRKIPLSTKASVTDLAKALVNEMFNEGPSTSTPKKKSMNKSTSSLMLLSSVEPDSVNEKSKQKSGKYQAKDQTAEYPDDVQDKIMAWTDNSKLKPIVSAKKMGIYSKELGDIIEKYKDTPGGEEKIREAMAKYLPLIYGDLDEDELQKQQDALFNSLMKKGLTDDSWTPPKPRRSSQGRRSMTKFSTLQDEKLARGEIPTFSDAVQDEVMAWTAGSKLKPIVSEKEMQHYAKELGDIIEKYKGTPGGEEKIRQAMAQYLPLMYGDLDEDELQEQQDALFNSLMKKGLTDSSWTPPKPRRSSQGRRSMTKFSTLQDEKLARGEIPTFSDAVQDEVMAWTAGSKLKPIVSEKEMQHYAKELGDIIEKYKGTPGGEEKIRQAMAQYLPLMYGDLDEDELQEQQDALFNSLMKKGLTDNSWTPPKPRRSSQGRHSMTKFSTLQDEKLARGEIPTFSDAVQDEVMAWTAGSKLKPMVSEKEMQHYAKELGDIIEKYKGTPGGEEKIRQAMAQYLPLMYGDLDEDELQEQQDALFNSLMKKGLTDSSWTPPKPIRSSQGRRSMTKFGTLQDEKLARGEIPTFSDAVQDEVMAWTAGSKLKPIVNEKEMQHYAKELGDIIEKYKGTPVGEVKIRQAISQYLPLIYGDLSEEEMKEQEDALYNALMKKGLMNDNWKAPTFQDFKSAKGQIPTYSEALQDEIDKWITNNIKSRIDENQRPKHVKELAEQIEEVKGRPDAEEQIRKAIADILPFICKDLEGSELKLQVSSLFNVLRKKGFTNDTRVPAQNTSEHVEENLKGAVNDWLKQVPEYQRAPQEEKTRMENVGNGIAKNMKRALSVAKLTPGADVEEAVKEKIMKDFRNMITDPFRSNDEDYVNNGANNLLNYLKIQPVFRDLIGSSITSSVDLLDRAVADWATSLPIGASPEEQAAFNDSKGNLVNQLRQARCAIPYSSPQHDQAIKDEVKKFLRTVIRDPYKRSNEAYLEELSSKLVKSLAWVPIQQMDDSMRLSIKPYKSPADILYEYIEDWCESLPLEGATDKVNTIKQNLAAKLINKIGALNMNPEIFNDSDLYQELLQDEVDLLLDEVPKNQELDKYLPALKKDFLSKIMDARQKISEELAGKLYKQQLRDRINTSLPLPERLTLDEETSLELLKEKLADAFINLNFIKCNNPNEEYRYKLKISTEIEKFCEKIMRHNSCTRLDVTKIKTDLHNALMKVPVPKDDAMKCEVEQVRIRDMIYDWMSQIPLRQETATETLHRYKLAAILAKRLHDIELEKEINAYINTDPKMSAEITKFLKKLPLRDQQNILELVQILMQRLKASEKCRKFISCRRSGSTEAPVETCPVVEGQPDICTRYPCTLSAEDQEHLTRIRQRQQAGYRDVATCSTKNRSLREVSLCPKVADYTSQTERANCYVHSSTKLNTSQKCCGPQKRDASCVVKTSRCHISPRVIVREYVWRTPDASKRNLETESQNSHGVQAGPSATKFLVQQERSSLTQDHSSLHQSSLPQEQSSIPQEQSALPPEQFSLPQKRTSLHQERSTFQQERPPNTCLSIAGSQCHIHSQSQNMFNQYPSPSPQPNQYSHLSPQIDQYPHIPPQPRLSYEPQPYAMSNLNQTQPSHSMYVPLPVQSQLHSPCVCSPSPSNHYQREELHLHKTRPYFDDEYASTEEECPRFFRRPPMSAPMPRKMSRGRKLPCGEKWAGSFQQEDDSPCWRLRGRREAHRPRQPQQKPDRCQCKERILMSFKGQDNKFIDMCQTCGETCPHPRNFYFK